MDSVIADFLTAANLAPRTEESYSFMLTRFLMAFDDPATLTAPALKAWLLGQGWGSATVHVNRATIVHFLKWRYGETHPAAHLKIKRIDSPPGRALTMEQVQLLLQSFDTSGAKGRRDLAICCLFLDSALRCNEVCNLLLEKVSLKEHLLWAMVKGRKWGRGWFSAYTGNQIESWLGDRPAYAAKGVKTLFVSIAGETPGQPMTRSGLGHEVEKWGRKIGIELSPHDFRRTFGNETARAGANERIAMTAGRWETESAYRRYTLNLQPSDIAAYSPVMRAMGMGI